MKNIQCGYAIPADDYFTFDSRNRKTSSADPLGNTTTWTYDAVGNNITLTGPDSAQTLQTYDAMNRLLSTRNPNLEITTYAYDAGNNLTSLTDARGNTYGFEYDALSRRTKFTYPGGSYESWNYNDTAAPGSVWSVYTARDGSTMSCTYDNRRRETFCNFSDPTTPDITKTYDAISRLLTASTSASAHAYVYDAANQLLSETTTITGLPGSFAVSHTYDLNGNRNSITYPGGTVVQTTHTARNQVASVVADGPPPLATFTYGPTGLPLTRTIENGTQAAYSYDIAGRLTAISHSANGTAFRTIAYTLDPAGRRTSRTENAASDSYGYDPTGQLTAATYASGANATYDYDATGNRETVTGTVPGSGNYTANALNQYLSAQSQTPAYDTRGNLTGFAGWTHTYDSKNRLLSASSNVQNSESKITLAYDYSNRAVSRTINGVTTYFVWDDWSLIEERDASGILIQKYIQGPGIDNLLAKTNGTGTVYYHQDGLGSTVALTDASGAVVENYTYDAFGAPKVYDVSGLPISVSGCENRFLFTGREFITEVGFYDYRNRAYDSELGRFLQTDPIRFDAGDGNLYRYVGNSPKNFIDPFGLDQGEPGSYSDCALKCTEFCKCAPSPSECWKNCFDNCVKGTPSPLSPLTPPPGPPPTPVNIWQAIGEAIAAGYEWLTGE